MMLYTLLVEVGNAPDDDMPKGATGAGLVLFVPSDDEQTAVREAVAMLRNAGMSPLEVTSYGTIEDREDDGYEFNDDERELAEEALEKDAIVIVQKQVFYDEDDDGKRN